jgi:hypothetical protein
MQDNEIVGTEVSVAVGVQASRELVLVAPIGPERHGASEQPPHEPLSGSFLWAALQVEGTHGRRRPQIGKKRSQERCNVVGIDVEPA